MAVAHGLPCILSLEDFDIPPLSLEDFTEEQDSTSHQTPLQAYTAAEAFFSIEMVKVAEALHHIHSVHYVRRHLQQRMTRSIADRAAVLQHATYPPGIRVVSGALDTYNDEGIQLCRQWLRQVPIAVKYDVDDIRNHTFWPSFLHILFLYVGHSNSPSLADADLYPAAPGFLAAQTSCYDTAIKQ